MRRVVPLLLLVGCDRLKVVDELTDPVVAQGICMGVEIPEAYADELEGSEDFPYAAVCNVFLAAVSDPSELEDAPVTGANIRLLSEASGALTFREVEDSPGKYTVDSSDGLRYTAGDELVVTFEHGGDDGRLSVRLPEAPVYDFPGSISREEAVRVDLSRYAFANAVGAAYDLDRSKLWWDNLPEAVDETYAFTNAEGPVEALVIPGEAFPRVGAYVVGVAGVAIADPVGFEGVNTTLSAFVAGRLALRATVVGD